MVRVGIIGLGMMGNYYVRTFKESMAGAEVVALASIPTGDGDPPLTHDDPFDLIRDPDVDAVMITSPDETHEAYVLACVESGKPVFCEKPLCPTGDSCRRIVDAELALGRPITQVGYMRRFDPAYRALKASLDGRVAGKPLLMHCAHRAPGPSKNRTTDLLMSNAAVHDFDALRWLLSEEITSVTVHLSSSRRVANGQFDPLLVLLRTESEVLIELEIFVNAGYGTEIRAEAVCEAGIVALSPWAEISIKHEGRAASPVAQHTFTRFGEAYRLEARSWIDSISQGRPPSPNAWDGSVATSVADACRLAIGGKRTVEVRVPDRPAMYS